MPKTLMENNPSLLWLKGIGMDFIKLSYHYQDPFIILKDQDILFSNLSADSLFKTTLAHKSIDMITERTHPYPSYFDYFDHHQIDSTSLNEPIRFKWRHKDAYGKAFQAEIVLFILKNDLYNNYYGAFILDLSRLAYVSKTTSNALYNLLTNARDATLIIDPKSGYILHANQFAIDFYGYSKKELHQMKISDINLLTPEAIQREMRKASEESRNHFNFRHRLANNDIWNVKVISGPFEYNHEKLLFSSIEPINRLSEATMENTDYILLFNHTPVPMVIMSSSLQILKVNPAFEKHFQFTNADLHLKTINDSIVPSEFSEESWFFLNMVLEGNTIEYDVVRQNKNRIKKSYHMTAYPLIQEDLIVNKFVAMYEEITEDLKQKHLYDLFLKTFDHIKEGVIITRPNKEIIWANKAFLTLTDYALEEIKNQTPKILKSGEHSNEFYENMWLAINNTGHWSGEIRNKTKNGETILEWLTILDVKNNVGQTIHYIGVIYDITNYKANEEKIIHLAYYDHLTQLLARGYFLERAEASLETAKINDQRLCLYYLDVDFFKHINDAYGHAIGDLALIKIALVLKTIFDQGELISRIGGDEFVVLSPCNGKNLKEVHAYLKKIEEAFKEPLHLDEHTKMILSVSVGYAIFPKEGITFDALLHVADDKMYQLKATRHYS
ncbi:diguanylate cyclase domain-containing protein [Fusibacter sp. 3D3]|uniref:diguanylate cyclase domain-containing protein n=1 Tax=Fusibacter sp. 3D3 TaxID=1048380 RepID=UPI0008534522|nr:diguanylate cyclase [Fusibacter sp. 3D3]GAU77633.1 diguanylate cyclase/phosphodiesterase [Fusibacter sp. 3D3]